MNDEFLILTPIDLESIRGTKFRYMTINLVSEESLEEEFNNVSHYLENIIESNPTLIEDTYLSLLSRITQSLNLLHSIELTEKQWETILGYWLINVINGISERWQTLERIERMDGFITVCLGGYDSEFSPRFESMEGKNFSESHLFNSYVYQQLLRYFPGINWKHFPSLGVEDLSKTNSSPCEFHAESKPKTRAKQLIKNSLRILFQSFKLKPEVFIVATWIPRINYFWMTILTRRVIFSSESQFSKIKSSHTEIETDRWLFAKEFDSNFIKACSEIIDRIAPLSLTTGFKNELHAIEEQGLNYYPEYVISNQHHCTGNDAQRIWFGVFGNANNQLNIIQHGGAYGCYESQWSAYTEMRISRVFMSWGWSALNPSVGTNVDVPALRLMTNKRKTGVRKRSDGGILFLLCPEPGYNSLFLPSQPYGPNEYLRYLHGILELMQSCNPSTTSKLSIRRQNQRNMLTSSFFSKFLPQVKQDDSTKLCFENWNLIVSTYNGTNSLESLLSGVPCVFYWDKNYSSFNKVSAPLFRRLQEVGVLHFSAESAKPILEMDNLSRKTWWSSSDVTEAVSNFLRFFGWTSGGNLGFSKILAKQINAKP